MNKRLIARGLVTFLAGFSFLFAWVWAESGNPRARAEASPGEFVPGEIVVQFKESVSRSRAQVLAEKRNGRLKSCNSSGLCTISLSRQGSELDSARELLFDQDFAWASPNFLAYEQFHDAFPVPPNDPYFPSQAALYLTNVPSAWRTTIGSESVVVAVIDTGVAYEEFPIPDYEMVGVTAEAKNYHLSPDLAQTHFAPGYDFINEDTHPNDDRFHGTAVAGVITQDTDNALGSAGVAPGITIMPIKALSWRGVGTLAGLISAIEFATAKKVDVINLSLGFDPSLSSWEFDQYFAGLNQALQNAHDAGIVIVAATGNSGGGVVSRPALHPAVIAVGASNLDGATRASYSQHSTGEAALYIAPTSGLPGSIELMAPVGSSADGLSTGVIQETIVPGNPEQFANYRLLGTSFAAPQVSGIAALMISAGLRPGRDGTSVDILREILRMTAFDLGLPGRDLEFGAGMVNAGAALATGSILVCHRPGTKSGGTVSMGLNTARGHIKGHGDTPGPCRN